MSLAPILVFGRSGQLAQELAALNALARPIVCIGRDVCDLAAGGEPAPVIASTEPSLVINAAAYTAVDKAEGDEAAAYALNRDAPGAIACACTALNIPFIHVSTDYVFGGDKGAPYVETDPRVPLGVYGASKAAGEDAVTKAGGRTAIVRVAWLYSVFGANFPKTMLRVAATRDELGVVDDQRGRPTSARFLAETLLALGDRMVAGAPGATGVFHLSPRGEATWADFAEAIFTRSGAQGGPAARVKRITTADYPTPAKRPADSRLDPSKLEALLNTRFPDWKAPLDELVATLVPATEPATA